MKARAKAYRSAHRAETAATAQAWRAAHPEERRALWRAWYIAHRLERGAYQQTYGAEHRAQLTASHRVWRLAHPERARALTAARRARTAGAARSHSVQEWLEKVALLGGVCTYCGEAKPLTRDHKIPLSRGGTDDIENILPACRSCNSRKRTRTDRAFLALRRSEK